MGAFATRIAVLTAGLASLWLFTAGAHAAERPPMGINQICGECRLEKVAACKGFLEGAAFDAEGTLWMVGLVSGEVMKLVDGQCQAVGRTGGAPNGAKFHADGRLFITDRIRGLIAFDPTTASVTPIRSTYGAENLRGLNDLVFDKAGGIYFTEPYGSSVLNPNGRVFYLPPGPNARPSLIADRIAFPNGIALSPDEKRASISANMPRTASWRCRCKARAHPMSAFRLTSSHS